jgi:hypothetical protein
LGAARFKIKPYINTGCPFARYNKKISKTCYSLRMYIIYYAAPGHTRNLVLNVGVEASFETYRSVRELGRKRAR